MQENKYFTKEQQTKALKWLDEKWPKEKRHCEICGDNKWTLANDLVMPLPFTGGGLMVGGTNYPHTLVLCNNCGNSKFFNAVIMGLVISKEEI